MGCTELRRDCSAHTWAPCVPGNGMRLRPSCSRQFCRLRTQNAGANIGEADGPEGEALEVPSNRDRSSTTSLIYAKRPTRGRFAYMAEREGYDCLRALKPLAGHKPALLVCWSVSRLSKGSPGRSSVRASTTPRPATRRPPWRFSRPSLTVGWREPSASHP